MGAWGWIKKTAKKVAKKAEEFADWVEEQANDAGDAAADAVEEAGNALGDALGDNRAGNAVKHAAAIIASVIKGVFDTIGVGIGAAIKTSAFFVTGDFKLFLEGITDVVSSAVGNVIVTVGHTLGLLGTLITIQDGTLRYLTTVEKRLLRRVFKKSLNYDVIKIIEGQTGFLRGSNRPMVLGNTIYIKVNRLTDELLVHECTHIWQYQNKGNRYATDAIYAQLVVPDEYNWEREINVRNKDDWNDFNAEAQAEFFEDLWVEGKLVDESGALIEEGNGRFYDADWKNKFGVFEITHYNDDGTSNTSTYTDIAKKAVNTVRNP